MNKTKLLVAVLVMVSAAMVGTGTAVADSEIGASGNCDDGGDDSDFVEGGGDGGKLGTDSSDSPDSFGSFFEGLVNLVQERTIPESDDMCDGLGPSEDGDDYYEVHAEGENQGVQYCYSDQNDDAGGEVHQKGGEGYKHGDCAYDEDGEH